MQLQLFVLFQLENDIIPGNPMINKTILTSRDFDIVNNPTVSPVVDNNPPSHSHLKAIISPSVVSPEKNMKVISSDVLSKAVPE
jgi:hypothetical protein